MINGVILGIPMAGVVWLLLRLTPRRFLNATTRYAVWWACLLLILCLSVPFHRVGRTPTSAAGPPAGMIKLRESAPIVIPLKTSPAPWITLILASWVTLSLILLIRLIAGYTLLHNRRKRAAEAPIELCIRAKPWLALRPGARLAISEEMSLPSAVGPWRPTILIPAKFVAQLDAEQLDQIVLHEAAHLARRDDVALLLERMVEVLLPLHPVVRWITRQIDLEREIACDDFVVEVLADPRSYARCLTRVVELSGYVRGSFAAAAVGDLSHLARRIHMLLDGTRATGTRLRKARLGAIVTALTLLGWMGGRMPGLVSFAMAQVAQAAVPLAPVPQPAQIPSAPKTRPVQPAAVPGVAAHPLVPIQDPQTRGWEEYVAYRHGETTPDPETARLEYRLGWELGYLHIAKNLDLDETAAGQALTKVNKELLQLYKSFPGTAAEQQAAIRVQRDRLRALVDELTEARLAEGRQ